MNGVCGITGEWHTAKLVDVAAINPPRKVKKGEPVPFIEMAALPLSGRDISAADVETRIAKAAGAHFQNGDTLLARITPCLENGKTAQVRVFANGEVGEGSTEFIVLCGQDPADNDFVYYLSRDQEFRSFAISRMEGTSGRQRVSWQSIAGYQFDLPPPEVRRSAAAMLSCLDDRIDNLRQTNATLEAIAAALFKSWFVDFDGIAPEDMQESELGLIPKGWRVEEIGKLVQCVGGTTPSTQDETFWEGGTHHWATPKDLSGLQSPILTTTERTITDAGVARIGSGLLPAGTLLMSSRAPIGYLAISAVPVAINQGFIAMPPGGVLSPNWLLFWAKANMEAIKQKANGSTFMEISKAAFRPIKIIVPTKEALAAFDEAVAPMLERVKNNEQHIATLGQLRDTLLPRLISGQLKLQQISLSQPSCLTILGD